jgi:homoserine dehydrogenase
MSSLRCGLIGCGTVGSALVRLWADGAPPEARLAAVAFRQSEKERDCDLLGVRSSCDPRELVRDPTLSLLIEATGDGAARAWIEEALKHGTHVVTANKALVAEAGPALEALASASGVAFRYEAAVAGAVPIVAHLRLGLSPGRVRGFEGVLNGTSNFILSRISKGWSFEKALRKAKEEGFAERDARRDTSGRDAADKVVILARLLGVEIRPEEVSTAPIDRLTPEDARFGLERGWALKQVATFRIEGPSAIARVAPVFVPQTSPLARAEDAGNVIVLDAGEIGRLTLSGPGAGGLPTAAALLSDVREIARARTHSSPPPPRRIRVVEGGRSRAHYVRVPRTEGPALQSLREATATRGLGPGAVTIAVDPRLPY